MESVLSLSLSLSLSFSLSLSLSLSLSPFFRQRFHMNIILSKIKVILQYLFYVFSFFLFLEENFLKIIGMQYGKWLGCTKK